MRPQHGHASTQCLANEFCGRVWCADAWPLLRCAPCPVRRVLCLVTRNKWLAQHEPCTEHPTELHVLDYACCLCAALAGAILFPVLIVFRMPWLVTAAITVVPRILMGMLRWYVPFVSSHLSYRTHVK